MTTEEQALNLVKQIRELAVNDRENLVNAITSCIVDGVLTDEIWNIANATAQHYNADKKALEKPQLPVPRILKSEYTV
jgi:hypothetical protein